MKRFNNLKMYEEFNFKPTPEDLESLDKSEPRYGEQSFGEAGVKLLQDVGFNVSPNGKGSSLMNGKYEVFVEYFDGGWDEESVDPDSIIGQIKDTTAGFFQKKTKFRCSKEVHGPNDVIPAIRYVLTKLYKSGLIVPRGSMKPAPLKVKSVQPPGDPMGNPEPKRMYKGEGPLESIKTFEEMGSGDMPACSCGKKKKKEKKQKKMKWTSEMIG